MIDLSIDLKLALGFLSGILVSLIAIPPVVSVSKALKLVALPNGRTSHDGEVPALGGIAIFAGVMVGISLFLERNDYQEFRFIILALILVFLVGLMDDIADLNWYKKLICEIAVTIIVVIGADLRIGSFFGFLGIYQLPDWFSIPFTCLFFVAIINSFNLLDGIDGLASGMGVFISIICGIWLFQLGYYSYTFLAFSLAGALISFFGFNVFGKKHKLFMGDSGSLLIGLLVAILTVKVLCCDIPLDNPLNIDSLPFVLLSILTIPLMDTCRVFALRIANGKSPFYPDRNHLHHIFLSFGLTHFQASIIIIGMNALIFVTIYLLRNSNPILVASILLLLGFLAVYIPDRLRYRYNKEQA